MYQRNKSTQCLICNQDLNQSVDLFHLIYQPPICCECLHQFVICDYHGHFHHYPLTILYHYNDFFRQLLYQYKGLGDIALKSVFLLPFVHDLKIHHRLVVVLPSSNQDNQKRGFAPNETIMKEAGFQIFNGLYKTSNYKQTKQKDRSQIKKVLKMKNGHLLKNKRVIIFDDVITSGHTLQAALSLVEQYDPRSIEILILSSKQIPPQISK